jgi:hypothetical protein
MNLSFAQPSSVAFGVFDLGRVLDETHIRLVLSRCIWPPRNYTFARWMRERAATAPMPKGLRRARRRIAKGKPR